MTRIIAGRLRSLSLSVPDEVTRPTTDRVREAVFSAVESRLDLAGVAVADFFAGSGALGLEAVSRGAETTDFFEANGKAARVLERNLAAARQRLGMSQGALRVERRALPGAVAGACPRGGGFDLVLIDPPYEIAETVVPAVLQALVEHGWLSEIAHVVVETSARSAETGFPQGLEVELTRTYGETRVELAVWTPPGEEAGTEA